MPSGDASIGQTLAEMGWSKIDAMMRGVGVLDVTALNSVTRSGDLTLTRQDSSVDCLGQRWTLSL